MEPFVNTLEIHAREVLNKPNEWVLFRYQSLPKDANYRTHFELTGAIPSKVLFKSGSRKGQPNPKFQTDVTTVIISKDEHRIWEKMWFEGEGT